MNAEEAVVAIGELIEMIDDDVPEKAWDKAADFFEDVKEKASDMSATIEESGTVSASQEAAIENWTAGVKKWIHD